MINVFSTKQINKYEDNRVITVAPAAALLPCFARDTKSDTTLTNLTDLVYSSLSESLTRVP